MSTTRRREGATEPSQGGSGDLIGAGRRRFDLMSMDTAGARPERSYFCRSCHLVARGRWVPAGWYLLERAVGGAGKHLRLGIYCSIDCLTAAKDELAEGARRGALAAGTTDRDRARLTEIARTMMHSGMTVRQAGDQ